MLKPRYRKFLYCKLVAASRSVGQTNLPPVLECKGLTRLQSAGVVKFSPVARARPYLLYSRQKVKQLQLQEVRSFKHSVLLSLKDGHRFQIVYNGVSNHWLCGRPLLWII